jgi:hypothetical protein
MSSHACNIPVLYYIKHVFSMILQVVLFFTGILLKVTSEDPTGYTAVHILNGLAHLSY